jgi:hypothetical protein
MPTPLDDIIKLVSDEEQHFACINECFIYFAALAETRHWGFTSELFKVLPPGLPTDCDDEKARLIHKAITDFIEKCPSHPNVGSCFRTLLLLNASEHLEDYCIAKLRLYYGQGDAHVVFQICTVLTDLGVDIFRDENGVLMQSRSSSAAEVNMGVARRFLSRPK